MTSTLETPELAVIFPSCGRPERARALLERLSAQSLAPERFEVVCVDDGSEPALELPREWPFRFTLLRQENAGPGAARNRALPEVRAPLCLILNDDAVPAPDLLAGHLAAHAAARAKIAVLGTFHFDAASKESAFVDLLDRTDLLFDFSALEHGELHGWPFFWTCNISLPTEVLRASGGFDAESFPGAVLEDVELGWRLQRAGYRILFRSDLVAEHAHRYGIRAYFERAVRLGRNLVRMYRKHGDASVLRLPAGSTPGEPWLRTLQATFELAQEQFRRAQELLEQVEREHSGRPLPDALVSQLAPLVARVQAVPLARGMLAEWTGCDPQRALQEGPRPGLLTSVIVVACGEGRRLERCLEALERTREDAHPIEILVVDNGCDEEARARLAARPEVLVIRNTENLGAPAARNQALARSGGEYLVFLDDDVVVTAGWLGRLLWHAEVDPLAACIGPRTDRSAHGQALAYDGGEQTAGLEAFAAALHARERHKFRHALLLSSFCLLTRRSVVERLGGFDTRFSPWGFEDDDFTLRAALLGMHNRVAEDVFVRHAAYSSGQRAARHEQLLDQNWRKFAEKWSLPRGAKRGDYAGLEAALTRAG
ncbi:MAG: glycosyltransferase [Planctomycetes bacterium]|nr:glycosyltransferase [Planctomycetota bacterium]